MKNFSLKELEKQFHLPIRKATYLIRTGILDPIIKGGKIMIPEGELERYLNLPKATRRKYHLSYLKTLGPGLITGAADDDCSGIGTYSQVGSAYGLGLSWLALYLLPMMIAIQETVARIGIVTGKGLAGAIDNHYGRKLLYPLVLLLIIANTINIGADIGAMVASLQLLLPINFTLGAILLTFLMLLLEISVPYQKYSRILKWLTISLLGYVLTGFIVKPDWSEVFVSVIKPNIEFNTGFLAALVAVMGTTISPYLFFWQASGQVEEQRLKGTFNDNRAVVVRREIKEMRHDTFVGMTYANIVFLFIVITTAFVFHQNGIFNIETAEQAAAALRPLAGPFASLLFTVGIVGVGLLAVPILAGSSAYAFSELFRWKHGLYKRYDQAKGFYGVIIFSMMAGLLMNFLGLNPIKSLYWAAIVNGIVSPILMFFIFQIGRNKKIMGQFTNPRWVNIWGTVATILMGSAAIFLLISLIF